ncbi:MAG TPA: hypothetical protein VII75_14740 [Thermoanaerobaculia bacterium]|nr:hypothetical protein [Thermoanaerobaculia bacterium]
MVEQTEELWSTLMRFHREVIQPDFDRSMDQRTGDVIRTLSDRMNTHFDAIYHRLVRIDDEVTLLNHAVKELETRMEAVEQKLDRLAAKAYVEALERRVREIELEIAGIKAKL